MRTQNQETIPGRAFSIAVIIPHLNRIDCTAPCYQSLLVQSIPPARILIVDNGSTEHDPSALAAACPKASIIRLDSNRGFAAAVNAGLREALADPAITHVWILNNDTVCPPQTLAGLLDAIEASPATGLAGCAMIEGRGTRRERLVAAGKNLMHPWMIPVDAGPDHVPGYLSGACMLIKRKVVADTGLFDESFFFFFEDVDFCLRARKKGWAFALAREIRIAHAGSATAGLHSEFPARMYRAGHIRLLQKHTSHPRLLALPPFLFRLGADALRGHMNALRGNIRGFFSSQGHSR